MPSCRRILALAALCQLASSSSSIRHGKAQGLPKMPPLGVKLTNLPVDLRDRFHFVGLEEQDSKLESDIPSSSSSFSTSWREKFQLNRPAYSAAPLSLNTSEYQYVLDGSIPINTDFDAVSVDLSYYGVPWNSFLYEEPLPISWSNRLYAMVEAVDAYEMPVFLQFAITGNDKRSCPASNASDYPGTTSPGVNDFTGCSSCFDYDIVRNPIASFIRQGYVNYALAVAVAFNATETLALINFGIDANRYLESGCSQEQWVAYTQFTSQVYATLKTYFSDKPVFPSFSLESMMGANNGQACENTNWQATKAPSSLQACASAGYAALQGIGRDLFAFSSFPAFTTGGNYRSWYLSTPLSYLSAVEKQTMVVASTGYLSTPISINYANTTNYDPPLQCQMVFDSTTNASTAWFSTLNAQVSNTAAGYKAFLVNFKSARDVLFLGAMGCPCDAPIPALQPYCNVLIAYRGACYQAGILPAACELSIKSLGTMGVRDLFGQPISPLYEALEDARKLPLR